MTHHHNNNTREKILETATHLIHLKGFKGTSLSDILNESSISKGNFFYYFKSKEELGFAVMDRMANTVREHMMTVAFRPDLKPMEQIYTMLDSMIENFREKGVCGGCPFGNLASELADSHDEFRKRINEFFISWQNIVQGTFDKAKSEGTLDREVDTNALAIFILSTIEGALIIMRTKQDLSPLIISVNQLKAYINGFLVENLATTAS